MRDAVIVDAVRTPIGKGKPTGSLAPVHPVDLLAHSLRALAGRTAIDPTLIDDVIGGCVDQVGEQAVNTTRWAVLAAGFPETVPATTVDRQCGSSQQAVHFAAQGILAGAYDIVIACGVESMSRVSMGSNVLPGSDPFGPGVADRYPDGLVPQGISAGASLDKVNVHGGAIAIGHPLGASGARLMTTLVHAMRARGARLALQTMCEAGGLANATILERL